MSIPPSAWLVLLLVSCAAPDTQPKGVNARGPEAGPTSQAHAALAKEAKIEGLRTEEIRQERIVFDNGSLGLGAIAMSGHIAHLAYSELVLEQNPSWTPDCPIDLHRPDVKPKTGCFQNGKHWRYSARYAQMQEGAMGKVHDLKGFKSVSAILPTAQGAMLVGLSETNAVVTSIAADGTQGPVEEFAPGEKGFSYGLDAALDQRGNLHIVWGYHDNFRNMELHYRVRTAEGQWSQLERLPTEKGVGINPSITIAPEAIHVIGAASATAPCPTLLFTKERQSSWRVQEIMERGGHHTGATKDAQWASATQYAGSTSSLHLFDLSAVQASPLGSTRLTASGQNYYGSVPVASWARTPVLLLPEADRVDLAAWSNERLHRTTLYQGSQERRNAVLAVEGDHFVAAWDEVTPGIWNQIVIVSGRLSAGE